MLAQSSLKLLLPENPVTLTRAHCLRYRFKPAGCQACVGRCPQRALSATERGLELNPATCRGCLLCLGACPTGALEGPHFDLEAKLAALAELPQPVLGCAAGCAPAHERLPCLGLLAQPELLLAVAAVVPTPLRLDLSACVNCPNGEVAGHLRAALENLEKLEDYPYPGRLVPVTAAEDLHYRPAGVSRREFFSLFRKKSSATAVRLVERLASSPAERPYRNKRVPRFRALLLRVWPVLPEPFRTRAAQAFFPPLRVTNACRGCTGCVGICPTGALAAPAERGGRAEIRAELCTDCGACSTFCRRQAIQMASQGCPPPDETETAGVAPWVVKD